ncbi:unnamed protein product [Chrysoparadoxa australica]
MEQASSSGAGHAAEGGVQPPDLRPLYSTPDPDPKTIVNPLLHEHYRRIGRNALFECQPAIVHFAGYTPGEVHTKLVKVVNISSSPQRLHILTPSTGEFKVRCQKKGSIAPGCCEVVAIDFYPTEYKYHYDALRIHSGTSTRALTHHSHNLMAPIHAYPIMNDHVFPETIDFGGCPLGKTQRRVVEVRSLVPIQFEFEISVAKPHPHLRVSPLSGVVPGSGSVSIELLYTPSTPNTADMELIVNISQFDFKPVHCLVSGTGKVGSGTSAAPRFTAILLRSSSFSTRRVSTSVARHQAASLFQSSIRTALGFVVIAAQQPMRQTSCHSAHCSCAPQMAFLPGPLPANLLQAGLALERALEKAADTIIEGKAKGVSHRVEMLGEVSPRPEMFGTGSWYLALHTLHLTASSLRHTLHLESPGIGSGAAFDAGGSWLEEKKRKAYQRKKEEGTLRTWASLLGPDGNGARPEVVEGLVIPADLSSTNATNFVLTQQVGKLKPKDLKAAIQAAREERRRQLEEREQLRELIAAGTGSISEQASLSGRVITAYEGTALLMPTTAQMKEMAFLQDCHAVEQEETEREFKTSHEHLGEPLISPQELGEVLEHRVMVQKSMAKRRREDERNATEHVQKGPYEKGAMRARQALTLLLTRLRATVLLVNGGYHECHSPDWDPHKSNNWSKRRAVLHRFIALVSKHITRARARRRLDAIWQRLDGANTREEVRQLVAEDNRLAKTDCSAQQDTLKSDGGDDTALVTSSGVINQHLVSTMLESLKSLKQDQTEGDVEPVVEQGLRIRSSKIHGIKFPMFEEDASTDRVPEEVDPLGPPTAFNDLGMFQLRAPQEAQTMGYDEEACVPLGTYLGLEDGRELRTGAYEEWGVRQPRDLGVDWQEAILASDREATTATFNRRRSSIGMKLSEAVKADPEELELIAVDRELARLAAEVESTADAPAGLLQPPPVKGGVDLITPDPRIKCFAPLPDIDESSPEWCLRPRPIPRQVKITKGLLIGYSIGGTSLRAFRGIPKLGERWHPARERRSSGLASYKDQSYRGIWEPAGVPQLKAGREKEDDLTDSESDADEGPGITKPTPELCRRFFEADKGEQPLQLERDRQVLQLEEEKRTQRDRDAERLWSCMKKLDDKVANLKHKFCLAKPFHLILRDGQEHQVALEQACVEAAGPDQD